MSPSPNTQPPAGGAKLVLVSLALAMAAVIVTNVYIAQIKRKVEGESFVVYRLTRSVKPDHKLAVQDVSEVPVPEQYHESFRGFITKGELEGRVGDTIKRSAGAGEFLSYSLFTTPDTVSDATQITLENRLVSLPVNSRTIPGMLRPGMYVDIEAPFDMGGAIPTVMTVKERVKILAMGTSVEGDEAGASRGYGSFRTITIELSPEEATQMSMIKLAASGDFELQVRNPADTQMPKIKSGLINPAVRELVEKRSHEPGSIGSPGSPATPGTPAGRNRAPKAN